MNLGPDFFTTCGQAVKPTLPENIQSPRFAKWIGNTVAIAAKHYVQVTDEDHKRAVGNSARQSAQSVTAKPCLDTSEGMSNPQRSRNTKSRNVVCDNTLRLLANFGCKSFYIKDLRKAEDKGLEPSTASRHLISSQAANQFAYPPADLLQCTFK